MEKLWQNKSLVSYHIRGNKFFLLPEKAIFWQEKNTLLISDLHLGKIDHFRKNGIGVPGIASESNFSRLKKIVLTFNPRQVIILGDLFHSTENNAWKSFSHLTKTFSSVSFELVLGNHDIIALEVLEQAVDNIYTEALVIEEFIFTHVPKQANNLFNFCGHIHPSIQIKGKGRQSVNLSCFAFSSNSGILPAFGTFTGTSRIFSQDFSDVFVIADREVLRITQ